MPRPVLLLLTVLTASLCATTSASAATPTTTPQSLRDLVGALGGSPTDAGAARYDDLHKLDGRIQAASAYRLTHGRGRVAPRTATSGTTTTADGVLVDVYVSGDVQAAANELRRHGMTVTATSTRAPQRMVEGYLPPAQAPVVAGLGATTAVASVATPHAHAGSVTAQSDTLQRVATARQSGFGGAGVKVGVMSDSMNKVSPFLAGSQATGDLPLGVHVLQDGTASPGDEPLADEGRAMAEIAYDEAPGITDMSFATGYTGAAGRATNIDAMVADGDRVIANDIGDTSQPYFQDGIVSQAVDRAKQHGVAYLSAAGNEGRDAWQGTFAPITGLDGKTYENFGSGQITQTIATVPPDGDLDVSLQWKQPWGAASTNFTIVGCLDGDCSDADTGAGGLPWAELDYTNDTHATHTVSIRIRRNSATSDPTPLLKYIAEGDANIAIDHATATNSPTVDPDAAGAAGGLAVAAVDSGDPGLPGSPKAEYYSSRGPLTRYFDANGTPLGAPQVRQKPEVAGIDGVATTVAGVKASDGKFYGTSAATPAVAGIAALILSARPNATVDQLYAVLENASNGTALTCGLTLTSGTDGFCGNDLLMADTALQNALTTIPVAADSSPPLVHAITSPAAPDGRNGWFRSNVRVGWGYTDPQTAITHVTGCGTAALTTAGSATYHCDVTSAGGTAHAAVTVKRDATAPAAPVVHGFAAGTYAYGAVPAAAKVTCTSSDATSGLASCRVAGVSTATGTHTATATATDNAGNVSTKLVTYTVVKSAAIKSLSAKRVGRSSLLSRGLSFSVTARRASTKLSAKVTVKVKGHRYTVGTATKTIGSGAHAVRVRLSTSGRRRVRALSRPTLTLSVTGRATNLKTTTLTRSVHVAS